MSGPVNVAAVAWEYRDNDWKPGVWASLTKAQYDDWKANTATGPSQAFQVRALCCTADVAELVECADNAEKIIRNCVNAGQIGAGYLQHADDLRDALAKFGSAA